jgi:alpha-galactosidase
MKKIQLLTLGLLLSVVMFAAEGDLLISTENTSLVLSARVGEELQFIYYGEKISLNEVSQIYDTGVAANRPAYPVFGIECSSEAALQIQHSDGNLSLDMVISDINERESDKATFTEITMNDKIYPFEIKVVYKSYKNSDIIETWSEIVHNEKGDVKLQQFASAYLPIRKNDVWISHLYGSWANESRVVTEPLQPGMKVIKNKDGVRNSHTNHAEVMISLNGKPQEQEGQVIGAALCWGGNFRLRFDTDDSNYHSFFAGINEDASEYILEANEVFVTPELALTYSNDGLGGVSRNFHEWARNGKIHGGKQKRDILLNSWEGVYFDISEQGMEQMMEDIADMGGELFVMDDGWFGDKYQRNSDNSSLGDWVVDENKLPNGIDALVQSSEKNGIKFGIWVEPEMTNTVSELYEKHPDWIICQPNREPRPGRGGTQLVLDLSNPQVQDFIYTTIDNLMTRNPDIAYIKWDANMNIANYGSSYLPAGKQSHLYIDYHRGFRKIMERIRANYPDLVIQACASGGGRANYGVLPNFDEFWVSDNTEALQRIYMQWGVSYFYPAVAMASHVGSSPNHQTGRIMPLKFRFDVAMIGRLGMEMQPKDMTNEEKDFSREAINTYKEIRPVIQQGDLYRLISPYDDKGVASLMYCTPEKDRAVFFAFKVEHYHGQVIPRFRMSGLDKNKRYRIVEINKEDKETLSIEGKVFSGNLLMELGIELPLANEYSSRVLQLYEMN